MSLNESTLTISPRKSLKKVASVSYIETLSVLDERKILGTDFYSDMAPVEENKSRGRPKGGGRRYAWLKTVKGPRVPTGNPRGRPSTGLAVPYVPTGNPKGRPKGSRKKWGDNLRKIPCKPREPRVPTGNPRGRPPTKQTE